METMTFGRDQTDWDLLAGQVKALQAHYGKRDAR